MKSLRSKYPPSFKAKVALEAIKEEKSSAELSTQCHVHPGQIRNWKATLKQGATDLFNGNRKKAEDKRPLHNLPKIVIFMSASIETKEQNFITQALKKAFFKLVLLAYP